MRNIRWGIIGCGDVTEIKSGPAFQKAERSELVAVMRRDGKKAADYAARHNVPRWYDDAQSLIDDPQVDAVYIATPPSSHKEYVLRVAAAGKPVYVEKPMAMSFAECREMVMACDTAGVPLFVAYYRRALPRFLKVKSLLAENAIGKVRAVHVRFTRPPSEKDVAGESNWRVDPDVAGCGYFCDLASHTLDLLQFQLGEITYAAGRALHQEAIYEAEDAVSGFFQFGAMIQGTGIWNFNCGQNEDLVELIGSDGKITYSTFANQPVILLNRSGCREYNIEHPQHIQQPLIQSIVDELCGKGHCPSSGKSAMLTNRVMDQLLGRKPG